MKKVIFTVAMLSAVLIGCKDNKQNEGEKVSQTEVQEITTDNTVALNNSWLEEIQLDQGTKWEANIETTQGVNEMAAIIEKSSPKTVEDYHRLAEQLNEQKNFIVKECTMEGPSHDNLHVFLHPLIEKIDALAKVSSKNEAEEILESVQKNIDEYYNYFK